MSDLFTEGFFIPMNSSYLVTPSPLSPLDRQKRWLLAGVGLLFVVGLAWTLSRYDVFYEQADLIIRWYATGQLLHEGRDLYDLQNVLEARQPFQPPGVILTDSIDRFYYPAHLILLLLPLANLPYPTAHFIWLVFIQLIYLLGVWLAMEIVQWPASINRRTLVMVLAVVFIPYLQQTIWTQFNTIALLGVVLCYQALIRGRIGWAGIWLATLTFKPQSALLTILFCLFWALWRRERWQLIFSFGLTCLAFWGITEWFQPGWVGAFLDSLQNYIPTSSVLDNFWNPYQITALTLVGLMVVYFFYHRAASPDSPAFMSCLTLSLSVWFLIVPIVGMFHVLLLVPAVIWQLAYLERLRPRFYLPACFIFLTIYVAGWITFLAGVLIPGLYGLHISWAEASYKVVGPVVAGVLALLAGAKPSLLLHTPERNNELSSSNP